MATVAETRLFPPILAPYFPAKNIESINTSIQIPFDINDFNDPSIITEVHVMITRQSNYQSLFKTSGQVDEHDIPIHPYYPLGIYPIAVDQTILNSKILTIPTAVISGYTIINVNELDFNEYYKVQIRFSSVTDPDLVAAGHSGVDLSNRLLNESAMAQFSEWSSVGLMRFIAEPTITIKGNIDGDSNVMTPDNVNPYLLDTHYLDIFGSFTKQGNTALILDTNTYDKSSDQEYLASWKVQVLNTNDEVLVDSGVQEVNFRGSNINEIKYNIPFYFETDTNYNIVLSIVTANLYENSYTYLVRCEQTEYNWGSQEDVTEYTSLDSVIGKVNISFEAHDGSTVPAGGKFTIRRADNTNDFNYWEPIWSYSIDTPITPDIPITFDDFTIESGTIYKYSITYTKANGDSYNIVEAPVLSVFDHAFLVGEGTQLCVKFNPNLNNFKINVSDNSINTIGGQYPYITRNGNMRYRSFGLSGTIAYEMDAENQFATRASIYGQWFSVYGSYFVNRYINATNDRITQREFRELVMDFLYNDTPKLFRSTPEGNILVRLTDISLTPNTQLARMIYDFSCTATEIGECSIDNYKLYQIQDFGDLI